MKLVVVTCDSCHARLPRQNETWRVRLSGPRETKLFAEVCSVGCGADWLLRIHEREAAAAMAEDDR